MQRAPGTNRKTQTSRNTKSWVYQTVQGKWELRKCLTYNKKKKEEERKEIENPLIFFCELFDASSNIEGPRDKTESGASVTEREKVNLMGNDF